MLFDCNFRNAIPSDGPFLSKLISSCWTELYRDVLTRRSLVDYLNNGWIQLHVETYLPMMAVAEVSGMVVGCITICGTRVDGLFVDSQFRGNLIGFSLLHNAVGAGAVELDVAAFNFRARLFYERNGWTEEATFLEDVGGTDIKMLRMLYRGLSRPCFTAPLATPQ